MRPFGEVTGDLEKVLEEMIDEHNIQWYEVLSSVHGWLQVHAPQAREEYEDGTHPVFYYGHKDSIE